MLAKSTWWWGVRMMLFVRLFTLASSFPSSPASTSPRPRLTRSLRLFISADHACRNSTRYELNLPPRRSSSASASTEQLPKAARPPPTSFLLLVVSRRSHSDELYSRRLPILAFPLSNPEGLFKHPLFRSKRREESENVDGGKKGEKEGNGPRLYGGGIRSENSERKQSKVSLRVGGRGRGREERRKKRNEPRQF